MSKNENVATEKRDVYAQVTEQIVAAIEKGVGNWQMPWHTSGREVFSPINVASRKPYRGINTICLWAAADAKGYGSGEWGTYKQWQESGAQVRKGEKATVVVFWKFANETKETQEGDEGSVSRLMFARTYSVFNAAQVDGYTPKVEVPIPTTERIERADRFFKCAGANVQHGGNRAYYSPLEDRIQMPTFDSFKENLSYYSTLAHEHTHWTAKRERCDRRLSKRFGDSAYAAEELIAEIGAAFACAYLGIGTESREDHAQYIQSWLKVLKADKRAIFTAASKAQEACDWLVEQTESPLCLKGVAA